MPFLGDIQSSFNSLSLLPAIDTDLSDLPPPLLPDHLFPASRRSKDIPEALPLSSSKLASGSASASVSHCCDEQIEVLDPSKERQLAALEYCIKLLSSSSERPRVKSAVGVWMTM
eukprot:767580-Hanusia_phi.AAC.1